MTNKWKVTIGIEIHLELNTKSKMFSAAPNKFGVAPNTNIAIFDIGYPGALPSVNKAAVVKAIKLAKALRMQIDDELHFDRKHYFYPDLPRGFQITQHWRPIATNGILDLGKTSVQIARLQIEEDTAKSIHHKNETLLNYNRSGVPLIEIVTLPCLTSPQMASDYVAQIRQLARFLNISDAKMEAGSLRADLNVSMQASHQTQLGTKVEIKNVNSITNVKKALRLEIASQQAQLEKGLTIKQVTKRYDDKKNINVIMRTKEIAADYKYFPEPNIPPIKIDKSLIDSIVINDLPSKIHTEFKQMGFNESLIEQLLNDKQKLDFIKAINYPNLKKVATIFFAEVIALANRQKVSFNKLNISPHEIRYLIEQVDNGAISNVHLKKIIPLIVNHKSAKEVIEAKNFKQISNEIEITKTIDTIIASNENFIKLNLERPERVIKFLTGQAMKISKGQINPVLASKIIKRKLVKIVETK